MTKERKDKKTKYINPPNILKAKMGSGGIPQEHIKDAEQLIRSTTGTDFRTEAQRLLKALSVATKAAHSALKNNEPIQKEPMIRPMMQLKANGGMFQYRLLSDVADICLQFMEVTEPDKAEAIDIIRAHENAIDTILKNDLHGDGGAAGYALVQELHLACTRYFKKYNHS